MRPCVVVDAAIPYIQGVLEPVADVIYLPAKEITASSVRDADVLIIRTRTQCNATLLEDSTVQLIITATIGFDHIDLAYCEDRGIVWRNAPGCNANAVAQYITSSILYWKRQQMTPDCLTMGIIGVGNVGSAVARMATTLGIRVLLYDPPRAKREPEITFSSLHEISQQADIITFHTPLTFGGAYPTYHLADREFFDSLARQPLIINTARGGVIHEQALLRAIDKGWVSDVVIDCWEDEPTIERELLQRTLLSTPHIAGYSADGKLNATLTSIRTFCSYFDIDIKSLMLPHLPAKKKIKRKSSRFLNRLYESYPIHLESEILKANPEAFEQLRSQYQYRREVDIV